MADHPTLTARTRTPEGSRAARRLRREGLVPGVLYGDAAGDGQNLTFSIPARDLRNTLASGAAVFDLLVEGARPRPVMVKEQQLHPVRGEIVHIDLLQVRLDQRVQAAVTVELEGVDEAPGVIEGGVIDQPTRELNVEALPDAIPEGITVNVAHLEAAQTMHLSELTPPEGVTFLDDPEETIIATVTVPTPLELPEEVEEETALVGESAVGTDVPATGEGQPSGGAPTAGEAGTGGGSSST